MDPASLSAFLLLVGVGAYIQTLTGFAMGLIIMGSVTAFDLAPVAFSAVVVSFTALANNLLAIRGEFDRIERRTLLLVSAGMLPATYLGLLLLDYLSLQSAQQLKLLLGGFILIAGLLLMLKPEPRERPLGGPADLLVGGIGGLFGGLFATGGPPVVYHLYRQPLPVASIRITLMAIFALATLWRLLAVAWEGGLQLDMLTTSLYALPVVFIATFLGRRWRPELADRTMRRLAFALLGLLGISLLL